MSKFNREATIQRMLAEYRRELDALTDIELQGQVATTEMLNNLSDEQWIAAAQEAQKFMRKVTT